MRSPDDADDDCRPDRPRRPDASTTCAPAPSTGGRSRCSGLARSGIALARFLADAGARVTVYDGRPADGARARRSRSSADRAVTLRLGPDVDPAATWAGRRARRDLALDHARLPDDRAAPPRRSSRRSSPRAPPATRTRPALVARGGPVPPAVPGADDRRDRDQGQDDDVLAGPRDPRRGPDPPRGPGRQHRHAAGRAPAGAHARPPRRRRAVRAPAADAVAGHDRRGLHQRHLRPPRPPRVASRPTGGSSAASPSSWTRTARSCSTSRTRSSAATRAWAPRRSSCTGTTGPCPAASACVDGWIVAAAVERLPLAGGGIGRDRARAAGSCRSTSWRSRAATTCPTRWPPIAVGLLFGVAPDAIRRAAAGFTGVEHRLQPVGLRRRRPLRQRLAGHPARRRDRGAARVRAAGRADRRRPRQGRGPDRAGRGRRARRRPPRC